MIHRTTTHQALAAPNPYQLVVTLRCGCGATDELFHYPSPHGELYPLLVTAEDGTLTATAGLDVVAEVDPDEIGWFESPDETLWCQSCREVEPASLVRLELAGMPLAARLADADWDYLDGVDFDVRVACLTAAR